MTGVPSGPRRRAWRWASLAALVLCVVQAVADAHVHVDEHEEDACTVCAFSDPGHVQEVDAIRAEPSKWRRSACFPAFSAILPLRPYEPGRPRAPPVSAS
ncbi:MAG: hypothetical protein F4X36_13755 [Gammaproteobacteria bacterium]|nr:hypothetical protein [Gammaproteobacteria bacterium]